VYKIFLTIRYLTRKKIVVFPILVVWLCLMMIIIVSSIMGGFVDRVRTANRELLGDIVISNRSAAGFPYYQELQDELQKKFPEIEASTPVVHAYALLNLPRYSANAPAQVMGIDPVGRAKVSKFRENLFRQYQSPMRAVEDLSAGGFPKTTEQLQKAAYDDYLKAVDRFDEANGKVFAMKTPAHARSFEPLWLMGIPVVLILVARLVIRGKQARRAGPYGWAGFVFVLGAVIITLGCFWPRLFPRDVRIIKDAVQQASLAENRAYRTRQFAGALPANRTWKSRQELIDTLVPREPSFELPPAATMAFGGADKAPKYGCIIGVQIGLFERDQRGNFDRTRAPEFDKVLLTVVPVSQRGSLNVSSSSTEQFAMIDDSYSGVYDVDSTYVYAPFEVVQEMALMRSPVKEGDPQYFPPRVNEILIKLKNSSDPRAVRAVRDRMDDAVQDFVARRAGNDVFRLDVETWDQKQAKYLNAVENEKVMQIFILSLMSTVVLVVVFLIFYMIVRDKTRDIGIIKAVGGSELGVMQIFLFYGLFIGIVGGGLGAISGVAFVTHTNEIHEWLFQTFGIIIWDRSVYLFDRIPDTVNYREVAIFYGLALLAGVVGAAIPAFIAGLQDPVKAVRYE
jgi:ABC-type lipoprotein release transport system permease subunit